jgi:DNA polymerase-3 subunit epsilon
LTSFDLETTGVDVETDRIVTAAVLLLGGKQEPQTHTWLADPDIEIPPGASAVHGITTERARAEGRPAAEVVALVSALLAEQVAASVPIVVMNAPYDFTLLDRELARHGLPSLAEQAGLEPIVIDPYVLDKHIDKWRPGSRKLVDMAAHYGVQLAAGDAHDAAEDALAAARIAFKMAVRYPLLQDTAVEVLHQWQTAWAREQAVSLQKHLRRKKDPAAVVSPEWPMIPRQRVTP